MKNDARLYFSEKRRSFIELLSALIAAKSVNPPGDEWKPAKVVEDFLTERSIKVEKYELEPGRTNVVASIGSGAPVLAAVAHLDTVPAGEGWVTDPFEAVEQDGRIYGRGACDNKGVATALLLLAEYISAHQPPAQGTFQIIFAADEEAGSRFGMEYLLAESIIKPDAVVVPDAANHMRSVMVSEKGALFIRIRSNGVQAHGSLPEKGINAIMRMKVLMDKLAEIDFGDKVSPLHTPSTLNIGCIRGGDAPNMVPAWCDLDVDIRYIPEMKTSEAIAKIDEAIAAAAEVIGDDCFSRQILADMPPTSVARDCLLARLIRASAHEILGYEPKPGGLSGTTVAKQCILSGIDAVSFSPGNPAVTHTANEWIEISEIIDFAAVMAILCRRFFGGK